ncbi:MAG: hypothetical protein Q8Q62_13630 [Mesorhizobium sp.]|nr:hypothetical protein [Mesorhizobium sp.]
MSDAVAARIAIEGLDALADARYGRGYPPGSEGHESFSYQPWRETPWPTEWYFEGNPSGGLDCMSLDRGLRSALTQDTREAGSYFSQRRDGKLLVIPKRRLVVVTFQD